MTLEKIIVNLLAIKNVEPSELQNEIICAFEDYSFKGESEIIVSSPSNMNGFTPAAGMHSAYANHREAPTIHFTVTEKDDLFTIEKAWVE